MGSGAGRRGRACQEPSRRAYRALIYPFRLLSHPHRAPASLPGLTRHSGRNALAVNGQAARACAAALKRVRACAAALKPARNLDVTACPQVRPGPCTAEVRARGGMALLVVVVVGRGDDLGRAEEGLEGPAEVPPTPDQGAVGCGGFKPHLNLQQKEGITSQHNP